MLPFTPRQKDNLAAWMIARSDGEHYGKLAVFQFPKQKVVFGPRQVVARINQDQAIAPQITLWNQQGSEVIQGTLLVIPIEESLIYIRPLYLRASGGQIPELNRVIVAHQDRIVMAETLTRRSTASSPPMGPRRRRRGRRNATPPLGGAAIRSRGDTGSAAAQMAGTTGAPDVAGAPAGRAERQRLRRTPAARSRPTCGRSCSRPTATIAAPWTRSAPATGPSTASRFACSAARCRRCARPTAPAQRPTPKRSTGRSSLAFP